LAHQKRHRSFLVADQYRYFAWILHKWWRGNQLLSARQINAILPGLSDNQHFMSIQTYDRPGNILHCPLYIDIDSTDRMKALEDARYVFYVLEDTLNTQPNVFYSGNKGYHIVIPYNIEHPRCHLIAKALATNICSSIGTIDTKVYTPHRMWRCVNSPASRPGYYKVQLTKPELFNFQLSEIEQLGTSPRPYVNFCDTSKIPEEFLEHLWSLSEQVINIVYKDKSDFAASNVHDDITPCLHHLLTKGPEHGTSDWNISIHLVARFLRRCALSLDESLDYVLKIPAWADYESARNGVVKVLKSVYRNDLRQHIGCRGQSEEAQLLRKHCDQLCFFREDFPRWEDVVVKEDL
jgi:hypothetical protein